MRLHHALDPIAAEFWNLNSYSGNSPARFYDPDGLMMKNGRSSNPLLDAMGLWGFGDKIKDWMDDNVDFGPTAADWAFGTKRGQPALWVQTGRIGDTVNRADG